MQIMKLIIMQFIHVLIRRKHFPQLYGLSRYHFRTVWDQVSNPYKPWGEVIVRVF
jgi:hypothetical protein